MARSSKVEACIFCGEIPCGCNKPAAKRSKPKRPPVAPEIVTSLPDTSIKDAMRAAIKTEPQPKVEVADSDMEEDMKRAVLVLVSAGMLHESELEKHSELISGKAGVKTRAQIWRDRNGVA